jgi:molybdopterin-containing oxidoreductase family membrane subunit
MKDLVTQKHLDAMSKVMLATGLIVLYGYAMEAFVGLIYSGNEYESYMMRNRMFGPYWWGYWALILCNGVIPQLLWLKRVRLNTVLLWFVTIVINIGMWLERFEIVVTSLHRDFVPSSWGMYTPTIWDWSLFIGTMGFFGFNMCLFIRFVPMISGFELRELLHRKKAPGHH